MGEAGTRESVGTLRRNIAELAGQVKRAAASAEGPPHRCKYVLLVWPFLHELLNLHLEWIKEVGRELATGR